MPTVELRDIITDQDWDAVMGLDPGATRYINPIADIRLEAAEEPRAKPHPWAVHDAETGSLVGFAMISDGIPEPIDDDLVGPYYLWKLLIDEPVQGRGYGTAVLDALGQYLRDRPGADVLYTSCADGDGSPRPFYLHYGFTDTGRVMWGENVLALDLAGRRGDRVSPSAPAQADARPGSSGAHLSGPPGPDTAAIAGNIAAWTANNAAYTDAAAERAWAPGEINWGVFGIRETDIGSPLGDVAGLDVVELGCGTAYFSAQLAYRGARPVGVDPTPAQLATARRMQAAGGPVFPLVEAPAEQVPLPDASFDLAFSEYGASIWADPVLWVPEAARLLRPGGRLVFLRNSALAVLCMPDEGPISETLQRPQFGSYRLTWPDGSGTEYHPGHGDWIRILRASGFQVDALIELQAPADAETHAYYDEVPADWGRRWPAEEIWVAHKGE